MADPTRSPDQQLAVDLAVDAGRLLVDLRTSGPTRRALGDLGDRRANTLILDRLAAERPGDAVLSEESRDDPARVGADRVWIIDPVDGTREYGLGDRPDWAVHVALWERSGDPARSRLTAAAVSLPALGVVLGTDDDEVYAAPVGNGSVDGGGLLPPRTGSRPRIVLSATRPPAFAEAVARAVGGDLVPLGSAGAKAAAVVRGEA
ncbi:MAG TPA: inositol monophosphatase family protein, partial [Dietzia sp.]|nr:inositol monophosphatase family protein [Dietzia sp.]